MMATRAKVGYDNVKVRAVKFKSSAKEKRKQRKRENLGYASKDVQEDIPAFFLPSRYKLLFKMIEDHKNTSRIARKPIPLELKKEIAR